MVKAIPLSGDYGTPQYYWQDIAQTTNNAAWDLKDIERRTDLAISLTHYLDLQTWGNHEIGGWIQLLSKRMGRQRTVGGAANRDIYGRSAILTKHKIIMFSMP